MGWTPSGACWRCGRAAWRACWGGTGPKRRGCSRSRRPRCCTRWRITGAPAALAADAGAEARLAGWGGHWLGADKVRRLRESAQRSVGIRQGVIETRRLREYAGQALAARQQMRRSRVQLERLARGHTVLEAQAGGVGWATACVLWSSVG